MPSGRTLNKIAAYALGALCITGCARVGSLTKSTVATDKEILCNPLNRAHAHNDYLHKTPLAEALENGFTSVEADVYLVDGELLVAHMSPRPGRSLQKLYLDPLKKRTQRNDGHVFADCTQSLTLLVDVKSDADETYAALKTAFEPYKDMLTSFDKNGIVREGAVTIVLSGNRPSKTSMEAEDVRYAAYDGRLGDLKGQFKSSFMPLVSADWGKNFKWHGKGDIPPRERKKLHQFVETAHENGQRIRFWATPEKNPAEREAVWKELVSADVDYIGTDHLPELRHFLVTHDGAVYTKADNLSGKTQGISAPAVR